MMFPIRGSGRLLLLNKRESATTAVAWSIGALLRVPLLSFAWFDATKCRNRKSASESGGSRSVTRRDTSIPLTLTLTLTVPRSGGLAPAAAAGRAVARALHRIGAELAR